MLAFGLHGRGRVTLVEQTTGEKKWSVQAHDDDSGAVLVALSPNGRFVASAANADDNYKLWEAASGAEWMTGDDHDGTGTCICGLDDLGRRVVQDGCPVIAHTEGINALAFSPCGQSLASGGEDGEVIMWDVQTGKAEQLLHAVGADDEMRDPVTCLAYSADGARLACAVGLNGGMESSIYIWTAKGGLIRTITQPHAGHVSCLHFSPIDSSRLASIGTTSEAGICLWDLDSGDKIWSIAGCCSFLTFSPDGLSIATAFQGGCAFFSTVDVESGTARLTLFGGQPSLPVCSAAFSANGSELASLSRGGVCKFWDSSAGALLHVHTIELGCEISSAAWGRDWVRDTQAGVAFAMGHHPRLGESSRVLALDAGVVRMILDRVWSSGASSTWVSGIREPAPPLAGPTPPRQS